MYVKRFMYCSDRHDNEKKASLSRLGTHLRGGILCKKKNKKKQINEHLPYISEWSDTGGKFLLFPGSRGIYLTSRSLALPCHSQRTPGPGTEQTASKSNTRRHET